MNFEIVTPIAMPNIVPMTPPNIDSTLIRSHLRDDVGRRAPSALPNRFRGSAR